MRTHDRAQASWVPAPRGGHPEADRYQALGPRHLDAISQRYGLPQGEAETIRLHSMVLPFRVNGYVLDNLIDWTSVPDDPIYQLVFPQPGMLDPADELRLRGSMEGGRPSAQTRRLVHLVRQALNPHPAGQRELNVPRDADGPLAGVQHKYAQTVLYFPSQGQTCHAYCTYCFRWAQFVGEPGLRFAASGPSQLVGYLGEHPEVSDVLITGGDPMIMATTRLEQHIRPLLAVPTIRTIRIGTKSLAYWPNRYVTDPDADDLLRLLESVVASGRTAAVMAHFSHARELGTPTVRAAMRRIRDTGAVIYCQAPLMRRVNDSAHDWESLWRAELAAGAVPYYMFMARDTGPRAHFEVPIHRAVELFSAAYRGLPGLARTVRGPVMSTSPGKVIVDGTTGDGPPAFQLRFLQARDPSLVGRPFRARHSRTAAWLDELEIDPATPADLAQAVRGDRAPVQTVPVGAGA